MNINERIVGILKDIGVPMHIKGYKFLKTAIAEAFENEDILNAITKELYPTIAKKHNTTPSRVERAIRHGVEIAYNQNSLDTLNYYFGNTVSPHTGKPTNGQFIATIVECIRLSQEKENG